MNKIMEKEKTMKEKLQKIREHAMAEIENSDGLAKLNDVRVSILGKKGELTAVLKGMKDVAPEDRPKVGQWVNETREAIEAKLEETKKKLEAAELEHRLEHEVIDVTLPAKKNNVGHSHPNSLALEEIKKIFVIGSRGLRVEMKKSRKYCDNIKRNID